MIPEMDNRWIIWGSALRSTWGNKCLTREQRFDFFRQIHGLKVVPAIVIFRCMDWEIERVKEDRVDTNPLFLEDMEPLPSNEAYAGWKKDARSVLREVAKEEGHPVAAREAYIAGRLFFTDIVRSRKLAWRFEFKNYDHFCQYTDPSPEECWFCGNPISKRTLITSLTGHGWKDIWLPYDGIVGGPICGKCLSSSPKDIGKRAAANHPEKEEITIYSEDHRRNRESVPLLLREFTSFSEIPCYDEAAALSRAFPKPKNSKRKAA